MANVEGDSILFADTDHPQTCERLLGHSSQVEGIAFIGASSNLVSCGTDGRLLLWGGAKPPFAIAFTDTNGMNFFGRKLVLSVDQRFCAVNGKIWSQPGADPVRSYTGLFLGFSPTSDEYVTESDGELRVWKCAETGTNPSRIFPRPAALPAWSPNFMSISLDGRFLACAICYSNILVFEARTGKLLANAAEHPLPAWFKEGEILDVTFLPTSHRLLVQTTGSSGGAIWDWQAPTDNPLLPLSGEPLAVSRDGRWITLRGERGRRLKLVETEASQKVQIELEGHSVWVEAVAFSHDGQTLVSVDARDELRFWKLPEGRLMGIMQVAEAASDCRSLVFSPDDQRLFVTGKLGVEVLEAPRTSQRVNEPPSAKPQILAVPADNIWAR
jgi:WD40 repeat protein